MPPKVTFVQKFQSAFHRHLSKGKATQTRLLESSNLIQEAGAQSDTIKPGPDQDQKSEGASQLKYGIVHVAKTSLLFLKESSDAFPPLKSLIGGLSFLLDNHEKWRDNQANLEKLLTRISDLIRDSQRSIGPIIESGELNRQRTLERKFATLVKQLEEINTRNQPTRYISTGEESSMTASIIEDLHVAITDYQFSLQKDMYANIARLISQDDINLLDKLPRAKNADHLSGSHSTCHLGTRIDILRQLEAWVEDPNALRVYWLGGHAGSGKSTIAQSFCHKTFASGKLGASFFCSRDFMDRSDIKMIFPTLAYQLGCRFPRFREYLVQVLRSRPDIGNEAMSNQLTELLLNPLMASGISTTIAIEALDECKDSEPASVVLSLLARVVDDLPDIKFFITGRPEAAIRGAFRIPALKPHTEIMQLHEVNQTIGRDITLYLSSRLSDIVKHRSDFDVSEIWPPREKLAILVQKSENLFIFASTAVKLLSSPPPFDPREGLHMITESPGNTLYEGEYGIDALYTHVLQQSFSPTNQSWHAQLRLILGTIVLAYNPLSSRSLSELLQLPSSNIVKTRLGGLHSLLMIPPSSSDLIRIYHKSFPDFLSDSRRCSNEQFYIDPNAYHAKLAIACLDLMKKQLRKNVCSLPRYSMNSEISLDRRRASIGEPLEYACRFWAQHVCTSATSSHLIGTLLEPICEFLQERQILWLEVLSLVDDLRYSVYSFKRLEDWLSKITDPRSALALKWVEDGLHFITRFFDGIRESAAHLYHSALPLSPQSSLLREKHATDLASEVRIIKGAKAWDSSRVRKVTTGVGTSHWCTFSHGGGIIAIQGVTDMIKLFDSTTGERLCTLEGSTEFPQVVKYSILSFLKFSIDDTAILSSNNQEVRIWDVQTGALIKAYLGHKDSVTALDFSVDERWIASGDCKGNIFVWERNSGAVVHKAILSDAVTVVLFTRSKDVLVACTSNTINLLTLSSGSVSMIHELPHHSYLFAYNPRQVVLSDDRTLLAYITPTQSQDKEPMFQPYFHNFPSLLSVYDLESHRSIWTLETSSHCRVLAVRHRSATLLTNVSLQQVDLSDNSKPPTIFASHAMSGYTVSCAAIAPDRNSIAYLCQDGTLQLHQIKSTLTALRESTNAIFITRVQLSSDGTRIVAGSDVGEILVYNVENDLEFMTSAGGNFLNLSISPNKTYFAVTVHPGSDFPYEVNVRRFQGQSFEFPVHIFRLQRQTLTSIFFLDEETCITSASMNGDEPLIEIWDISSGARLAAIWGDHHYSQWSQLDLTSTQISACTHRAADRAWHLVPLKSNVPLCTEFYLQETTPVVPRLTASKDSLVHPAGFDKGWVLNGNGQRLLWLPEDSQMYDQMEDVLKWRGRTLVFGGFSGTLTVMDFSALDITINIPKYSTDTILGLGTDFIRDLRGKLT